MKAIKISPKSWHYRLVTVYFATDTYDIRRGHIDSCSYTRRAIAGAIAATILTVIISCFLSAWVDGAAWLLVSLTQPGDPGEPYLLNFLIAQWFIIVAVLVVFCIVHVGGYLKRQAKERRRAKENSIVYQSRAPVEPSATVQLYRAFKHKYCCNIEIEDDA